MAVQSIWVCEKTKQHHKNTRLHVSCPPSHHLTITVSVQLGTLISIILRLTGNFVSRETAWMCEKHNQTVPVGRREMNALKEAVVIHSFSINLWIVCKSCYLVHDAPGSTCSNQICLPFPVRRKENPNETPSPIGCMKHHSRKHYHVCTLPVTLISISMAALCWSRLCVVILYDL